MSRFDYHYYQIARFPVRFADGSEIEWHVIGQIDNVSFIDDLARFVLECQRIRAEVLVGSAGSRFAETAAPSAFRDEFHGVTATPPRLGAEVEWRHGRVVNALNAALRTRSLETTNQRYAGHGPDLYTIGNDPCLLFEVKTSCDPYDVYTAIGQLQFYNWRLNLNATLIFVAPTGLKDTFAHMLQDHRIRYLAYVMSKEMVDVQFLDIDRMLRFPAI